MANEAQIIANHKPRSTNHACPERSRRELRTTNYFSQNKPNLPEAQMNITAVIIKNYEENRPCSPEKTNPIQTQFKPSRLCSWQVLGGRKYLCLVTDKKIEADLSFKDYAIISCRTPGPGLNYLKKKGSILASTNKRGKHERN